MMVLAVSGCSELFLYRKIDNFSCGYWIPIYSHPSLLLYIWIWILRENLSFSSFVGICHWRHLPRNISYTFIIAFWSVVGPLATNSMNYVKIDRNEMRAEGNFPFGNWFQNWITVKCLLFPHMHTYTHGTQCQPAKYEWWAKVTPFHLPCSTTLLSIWIFCCKWLKIL